MASNKIKGLTVQIGADTLGLDTALKGIEQKTKKAADELKDVNKTIRITGESATLWDQKQKLLNTALDESKKKLGTLIEAQSQVKKQLADKTITGEQYRAFQREVEYAKSAVDKYEKELAEAKDKVGELGSASDAAAREVDDFGDETSEAAEKADKASKGGLTAVAVALGNFIYDAAKKATQEIVGFGKEIVSTGMTFESSMSSVEAISGATAEELEQLEEKAKEMGATTKFTAAESADAFGYMALAGWNVSDMLSGIDGVLELAASSNMDLAKASDIVTDYLTAFGLTAQDSSRFVDIMTYAMANSNTTTEMLGEAYKNCAATAASMGYSVEDTTAVLMTMANAGIKGGEAGTALNAIMTRLATDTKNCATELAEYGVNVYDAEGNMQSLSSILEGVSDHWETLTDQEQANLAKMLAGTNHYAALQTIMSGLSDTAEEAGMSFGDYTKALEECEGAATDMSHTMIDNLQGDMTILDSAVDGMKLSLADELNPALRDVVQYVTKQMPNIQKVMKPIAEGAGKLIKGITDNLPAVMAVIKQRALPVIEVLGGALKNAYEGAKWLVEKLPGVSGFVRDVKNVKLFSELTEDARALNDGIRKDIEKMRELRDTAREQTETDLAETYKTEALYEELKGLVDENGKVKKGYEDRVNYIIGELQQATGIEIQQVDGVIQKYDELQAKIEETIKKQRAQIFEKNYTEMYSEALVQNGQAASKIAEAQKTREENQAYIDDLNSRVKAMFQPGGKMYNSDITYDMVGEVSDGSIEKMKKWGIINDEEYVKAGRALNNVMNSSDSLARLYAEIRNNNHIIEQYEKAEEALANGNYSDAQGLFASIDNASVASFGKIEDNVDEAVEHYKEAVDDVGRKIEAVTDEKIKYGDTAIKAEITELVDKMKTDGLKGADMLATGIVDKLSAIDGFDTSALKEFMAQTGVDLGDILATTSFEQMSSSLRSAVTELLYSQNDLIYNTINSPSDARLYGEGRYDIGYAHHATGGTIGIGQQGIVAEAGPELLQVMNGGIKITPLSRTATNTPVGAGSGTTINNYNNTVYATVRGKYDVYGMAEDMATAERRIEQGKGR
ncbi:phage tail tape measure protein [Ruminococcus flavefaciens]|uniref:TP901 family phage tail tape measure protein n=1 Tax=Ruminococcus flavefaciens TaxID=1265 RepID=A0A315Y120_RUMFL|nr:phage tail tape measure protein [Ruminococcus flavefaciens]PWJ13961.1 TP901 family phage tail tape measure protein [Ruminococcus flavefaciens]SSA43532.1 phage tail tape measure protein, TP901 family, core region [Ruminococcus flavefaciens]